MKQILPPVEMLRRLCGAPEYREQKEYRLSSLCLAVPCADGTLLYHNLTGEMLLLSEEELRRAKAGAGDQAALVEKQFLVPLDFRETEFSDQLQRILALTGEKNRPITQFLIFSTTDCNAHCFYCYEHGCAKRPMGDETARKTADYILRVSAGEPVRLLWFGGEPLYNQRAIEIIIGALRERELSFSSEMVSNAYLFDAELVRRAAAEWKLKSVQIPIDGTEEVYNRIKAYGKTEESPYRRVMRNISLLLDAGVSVRIRLNLQRQNAENLTELADEIAARFPGRKNLSAYIALIRNDDSSLPDFTCQEALAAYRKLDARLLAHGLRTPRPLKRELHLHACEADDDRSATILPGGELVKCFSSCGEDEYIGTIFSDERRQDRIDAWKVRMDRDKKCESCPCYPDCLYLKKCMWTANKCDELDSQQRLDQLREQVLYTYQKAMGMETTDAHEECFSAHC